MKAPLDQPLLLPGCRPLLADITVSLRAKTFNELCLFSSQLYEVGLEIVRLYYAAMRWSGNLWSMGFRRYILTC